MLLDEFDRLCTVRALFAAGWWLVFGGKHPPRTWSEITAHPLPTMGMTVTVLGTVGQLYVAWATHHMHL